jgi:hypothetical protein
MFTIPGMESTTAAAAINTPAWKAAYACLESGAWVSQPAPRGVSVNVLLASPSVKMDFHDSPVQRHAAVVRKYPKNWTPPSNQGRNQNPKDDKRDERGTK